MFLQREFIRADICNLLIVLVHNLIIISQTIIELNPVSLFTHTELLEDLIYQILTHRFADNRA